MESAKLFEEERNFRSRISLFGEDEPLLIPQFHAYLERDVFCIVKSYPFSLIHQVRQFDLCTSLWYITIMEDMRKMGSAEGIMLSSAVIGDTVPSPFTSEAMKIAGACTRCRLCQKECSFLQKYGLPGDIAEESCTDPEYIQQIAFSCSLCGLCAAVCPVPLDPVRMFLDLRRQAYAEGRGDYPEHRSILAYGQRGASRRYSWYSLPEGCDTVFFPGCNLPGSRPDKTEKLYDYLLDIDRTIGIVLDCCSKPSHDLGRQQDFEEVFFELREYLLTAGVRTVIVACPNCHKVFSEYGAGLAVVTIYERMAEYGMDTGSNLNATVTVHDPCAVRFAGGLHAAIRTIAQRQGVIVQEMQHSREHTFCCGQGGAAGARERELSQKWTSRRVQEANGRLIITYCAGCTGFLQRMASTSHLVDLLFEPQLALAGKAHFSRTPFTYINRIRLKRRLKRKSAGTLTRERPVRKVQDRKPGLAVSSLRTSIIWLCALVGILLVRWGL